MLGPRAQRRCRRAFVQASRYPFDRTELKAPIRVIGEGLRGSVARLRLHACGYSSATEYMEKRDTVFREPERRAILSLKMEDSTRSRHIDESRLFPASHGRVGARRSVDG